MRKSVFKSVLFVLFSLFVSISGYISAAELKLPEVIRPGDLFVVNLLPDQQSDRQVRFKIDTKQLQFMGAQQGTPDIQIKGDAEFEIKPESGTLAARYDLLFQPLSSGSAVINYLDSRGEHNITVVFTPLDASRGYSWLILAVGVVLLIVGIKLWRYQKSAPEMMSTKSLFMNYEELEKARKMYFPEEPSDAAKQASMPAAPDSVSAVPPAPAAPQSPATVEMPKPSSGSSTSKQQAVKPVNVASRLAQFVDDDDESSQKPEKPAPKTVSPVVDKTSPATSAAPTAPGTRPKSPAAESESTVPVCTLRRPAKAPFRLLQLSQCQKNRSIQTKLCRHRSRQRLRSPNCQNQNSAWHRSRQNFVKIPVSGSFVIRWSSRSKMRKAALTRQSQRSSGSDAARTARSC